MQKKKHPVAQPKQQHPEETAQSMGYPFVPPDTIHVMWVHAAVVLILASCSYITAVSLITPYSIMVSRVFLEHAHTHTHTLQKAPPFSRDSSCSSKPRSVQRH